MFKCHHDNRTNIKQTFSSHTPELSKITRETQPSEKSKSYQYLYSVPSPKSIKSVKDKGKKKKKYRHRSSNSSYKKSPSTSSHSSSNKVNISSYEVLDTVGCGSFAKVSRVRRKSTKEILVWKELSYGVMNDKEKQMLCDEVNILRDLNHPNIVKFIDRIIDHTNRKIYIVQEYCDGGDLASYIKSKRDKLPKMSGRISESFIWSVTSEIASALQNCHNHFNRHNKKKDGKRRILHRDLKPGNVFLVKRRGSYSVKLGDFGLAKMLDESSIFAQTHVGTPYYMSPEQIQSKSYNEKSDIWSLGCIVYEMAMLSPPFKAANYWQLAEKIKLGIYKNVSTRSYSTELENAISMMLQVNTTKRAKVENLLCLARIQYTLKILRLDRRYCQLKKKEYQFNLKMKLLEDKYKRKSIKLVKKENELKLKENELKLKEHSMMYSPKFSVKSSNSTKSNNSTNSNTSNTSNSNNSNNSTNSYIPISPVISASTRSLRTNSTSRKNSFQSQKNIIDGSEKKDESLTNSGDELCTDKFRLAGNSYLIEPNCDSVRLPVNLNREDSRVSNLSVVSGLSNNDVINDTKNCPMEKVNLSDLNVNGDITKFRF